MPTSRERSAMNHTEENIRAALGTDIDPYLGQDLVKAGAILSIDAAASPALIKIELGFPVARYGAELETRLKGVLSQAGIAANFEISSKNLPPEVTGYGKLPAWVLPLLTPKSIPIFMVPAAQKDLFKSQFDAAYAKIK